MDFFMWMKLEDMIGPAIRASQHPNLPPLVIVVVLSPGCSAKPLQDITSEFETSTPANFIIVHVLF